MTPSLLLRVPVLLAVTAALPACGVVDRLSGLTSGLFGKQSQEPAVAQLPQPAQADATSSFERLAREALAAGDAEAALPLARRAVERQPRALSALMLLGEVALAANQAGESLDAFSTAEQFHPDSAQATTGRAIALLALGRTDDAGTALDAVTGSGDAPAPVLANAGLAYALIGRPHDGVRALERAVVLPEATARIRQNLALAYALAGDPDKALAMAMVDLDRTDARQQLARWSQLGVQTPGERLAFLGVRPDTAVHTASVSSRAWRQQAALAGARLIGPEARLPAYAVAMPASAETVESPATQELGAFPAPMVAQVELPAPATPPAVEIAEAPVSPGLMELHPVSDDGMSKPAPRQDATPEPAPVMLSVRQVSDDKPAATPQVARLGAARPAVQPAAVKPSVLRKAIQPKAAAVAVISHAYAIQLASLPEQARADSQITALRTPLARADKAVAASLRAVAETDATGATRYRVLGGNYPSAEEARPACRSLRRKGIACFIRPAEKTASKVGTKQADGGASVGAI